MLGDGNTEGRVGNGGPLGHFVAVFGYGVISCSYLGLWLYRARRVSSLEEFVSKHIPERDPKILRRIGLIMSAVCGLGIIWESKCLVLHPNWGWSCPLDKTHISHISLYSSTGFTGLLALLESQGRIPQDSARAGLILTGICGYMLWAHHAMMKPDMTDKLVHTFFAYLGATQAIVTAISYLTHKLNWFLYMFSMGGVFFLQFAWMTTATVNAGPIHIYSDRIMGIFIFQLVGFTTIAALVSAYCGIPFSPPPIGNESATEYDYLRMPLSKKWEPEQDREWESEHYRLEVKVGQDRRRGRKRKGEEEREGTLWAEP